VNGHHLILGELRDYLTGTTLIDTHDERYRQQVARFLVERKRYSKRALTPRYEITVNACDQRAVLWIDLLVSDDDRFAMLIKYGPGSTVTRQRPALACARIVAAYQIPIVVVTNGEHAEILDGPSGKIIGQGLQEIPAVDELRKIAQRADWEPLSDRRRQMEERIVFAYEVDGACPCDTSICRLD
jgi:hypothetical protein